MESATFLFFTLQISVTFGWKEKDIKIFKNKPRKNLDPMFSRSDEAYLAASGYKVPPNLSVEI